VVVPLVVSGKVDGVGVMVGVVVPVVAGAVPEGVGVVRGVVVVVVVTSTHAIIPTVTYSHRKLKILLCYFHIGNRRKEL